MVLLVSLFALIVGAVAALAAETLMTRRPWVWPRCPHCQHPLRWYQASAMLSVLAGKRLCGECGRALRWPRVAAELFLVGVWYLLVSRYGINWRVGWAMLAVIPLAMVLVTDLETRLIPNRLVVPASAVVAAVGTVFGPLVPGVPTWAWWHGIAGGALAFGVFWVLVLLGTLLWGEGALGQGDVKLALYMGLVVGFPLVVEALVLTFVFGFLGAVLMLLTRKGSLHSYFPYGPFLVLGTIVTMIWGLEIIAWYLR